MSEEKLTMDDFSAELEASFKKIEEGDMLTGTVISVDEKEVILDLKYYAEGVIRAEDFSNEPGFSLKDAVQVGDEITATVIRKDDYHGNILLSRAEANDILAWEKLAQYKEEKTVLDVKVKGIVNAGVIAYVEGIRGFIPASKLSLNYVEDLNEYLNKDIQVQVFDLDKEKDRLILSAREILREKVDEERKEKISNVEVGTRHRRNRGKPAAIRRLHQPRKQPLRYRPHLPDLRQTNQTSIRSSGSRRQSQSKSHRHQGRQTQPFHESPRRCRSRRNSGGNNRTSKDGRSNDDIGIAV